MNRSLVATLVILVAYAVACDTADQPVPRAVGAACTSSADCLSGSCVPFAGGWICSEPCSDGTSCPDGTQCLTLGTGGDWCLPSTCQPQCAGTCCGDDGCGGVCPDSCPGQCSTETCQCLEGCPTPGDTRACTAHGSCAGVQSCASTGTWSECDNEAWECTTPSQVESCQVGACAGTHSCQADCSWTECAEDCPNGQSCCAAGCVDLQADATSCGACERECFYSEAVDICYAGTCCIKGCRNGSEICDDEHFTVPSPYGTMYLVCRDANGGVAYVATNTGPPSKPDNVPRCRGWEENNQDPWAPGNLDYVAKLDCTAAGLKLKVDLSAWEGKGLYVGVHDQPTGGGHGTEVCITAAP
ncbi:MAG: hypothetical protein KKI08_00885 [Armatimonadetes bacterium]|nr:hypothetical protein [Armatimonadota bacterium]